MPLYFIQAFLPIIMKRLRFLLFCILAFLVAVLGIDLVLMVHGSFESFPAAEQEEKVVIITGTIAGFLGLGILSIFTFLLKKRI